MQRVGYGVRCISAAVSSRVRESAAVLWIWKASVLRIGEEIRQLKERSIAAAAATTEEDSV
jgi:DNA-binding IclR family transcriptional regulator